MKPTLPAPQIIITGTDIANVAASDMTKVNPSEYSLETVKGFFNDAKKAGYKI